MTHKNLDSVLKTIVDFDHYPLNKPGSNEWNLSIKNIHRELDKNGCCVLKHFIRQDALEKLEEQGNTLAPSAYYTVETVNAYNIALDTPLPDNHPGHITFERGNAFVARDLIPEHYLIQQLYTHPTLQQFLSECFDIEELHELSDPLAGLVMNVLQPGKEHPWHFDTNEFTVSLLTQKAEDGGHFEYCPNIRSPEEENLADVHEVITNPLNHKIKRLDLKVGDLQLFKGRYALHHVSAVKGKTDRHTTIFAYTKANNIIGTVERTRQLFGRVLPAHHEAEKTAVRSDTLID